MSPPPSSSSMATNTNENEPQLRNEESDGDRRSTEVRTETEDALQELEQTFQQLQNRAQGAALTPEERRRIRAELGTLQGTIDTLLVNANADRQRQLRELRERVDGIVASVADAPPVLPAVREGQEVPREQRAGGGGGLRNRFTIGEEWRDWHHWLGVNEQTHDIPELANQRWRGTFHPENPWSAEHFRDIALLTASGSLFAMSAYYAIRSLYRTISGRGSVTDTATIAANAPILYMGQRSAERIVGRSLIGDRTNPNQQNNPNARPERGRDGTSFTINGVEVQHTVRNGEMFLRCGQRFLRLRSFSRPSPVGGVNVSTTLNYRGIERAEGGVVLRGAMFGAIDIGPVSLGGTMIVIPDADFGRLAARLAGATVGQTVRETVNCRIR